MTIKELVNIFSSYCGDQEKLKTFGYGDAYLVNANENVNYPCLFLETPFIQHINNVDRYNVAFLIMQQTFHEPPFNTLDMQTECKQIGESLIESIRKGHPEISVPNIWDVNIYSERFGDYVYCARFELQLTVKSTMPSCKLITDGEA